MLGLGGFKNIPFTVDLANEDEAPYLLAFPKWEVAKGFILDPWTCFLSFSKDSKLNIYY